MQDRFENLTDDYGSLFTEVFSEQGLDYQEFEESVFNSVNSYFEGNKNKRILDIGCGDGQTLRPFVEKGWKNLTGIDLNKKMILQANKNINGKAKLLVADATNMEGFKSNQFDAIITAVCIHNIPKKERQNFWRELLRLNPKMFVAAEKIADEEPVKHKESYEREVNAIIKVYRNKHNLPKVAEEWIKHYEFDEREKLTLEEIKNAISHRYNLRIALEVGMCKTVVAVSK